jgi:hypothetical protein
MKLNRKKLNIVLPQIKAHLNVAVLRDHPEYPGMVDFLFQPRAKDIESGHLNRLTCGMGGGGDLFGEPVVEPLGKPILVDINRFRGALKGGASEPELKDGTVNGISILADTDDLKTAGMGKIIDSVWKNIGDTKFPDGFKFTMPRTDYELMAGTVSRFVSQDTVRMSMCGYLVDFEKGSDFINFVATDGRKLTVCKFPCKHPVIEDRDGFIFNPINLFIPASSYSGVQWTVNEYVSLIRIQTEDYSIDCWGKSVDGQFPNYPKVIPDKELNCEWMSLNAQSARNAFDSIKGLINNDGYSTVRNMVFFNAEDPKHIKLIVPGASVDIDGEASRPMRLQVIWDCMNAAFFDTPYTRFMLQDVNNAVRAEESRAVRGTAMTVLKIFMPLSSEKNADEWGIEDFTQVPPDADDDSEENSEIEAGVTFGEDDTDDSFNENKGGQGCD